MNPWILSAGVLCFALIPLGIRSFWGSEMDRLVAVEAVAVLGTFILLLLAQGMGRQVFFDLALAEALLSFGAGMAFVRFLERWL